MKRHSFVAQVSGLHKAAMLFLAASAVTLFLAAWPLAAAPVETSASAGGIRVDAGYPGGNIIVQRFDQQTVFVAPDQRDTQKGQWWFYWNFRLRAPADQPVTIVFSEKKPLGARGPAMSTDSGITWQWLGAKSVHVLQEKGKPAWSFEARLPAGTAEVRYAFCPPYLESHLRAWLELHKGDPALRVEELCHSRKGRSVELLRAGCLDPSRAKGVVLLTSRHHCCETMATYAMEGFLESVLRDDEAGKRWRSKWEVIAIPFMDKDGVEDGDQGKYRAPHDHNRDYTADPLYPEAAALMKLGESLRGRMAASLDLHCPYISGEWNDRVYIVGLEQEAAWRKQLAFGRALERLQEGPIRFRAQDCLAFGTAWNTKGNYGEGRSEGAWARETFSNARVVTSLEIAYADAFGTEVNAASARALGRDLARALADHLENGNR